MDIHELAKIVETIEYKPGWKFGVQPFSYCRNETELIISADLEDTYNPGSKVLVAEKSIFPNFLTPSEVARFIYRCILDLERHETEEWFRVDGVRIYDPHKGQ